MELKVIKTHPDAKLPERAHGSDSGYDIYSVEEAIVPARGSTVVNVGLKLAFLTEGWWFRIEPRSGLGFKHNIQPHLGIIDNGYRGDLGVKLYNFSDVNVTLEKGSRIAQLILYPHISFDISETDKIHNTERGADGFGSTGGSAVKKKRKKRAPKSKKKDPVPSPLKHKPLDIHLLREMEACGTQPPLV